MFLAQCTCVWHRCPCPSLVQVSCRVSSLLVISWVCSVLVYVWSTCESWVRSVSSCVSSLLVSSWACPVLVVCLVYLWVMSSFSPWVRCEFVESLSPDHHSSHNPSRTTPASWLHTSPGFNNIAGCQGAPTPYLQQPQQHSMRQRHTCVYRLISPMSVGISIHRLLSSHPVQT